MSNLDYDHQWNKESLFAYLVSLELSQKSSNS